MALEPIPRIRLAPLPDHAVLVLRGDDLEPSVLLADASRFLARFRAWGRYGLSAFVALDAGEVDALLETKLERFASVAVFQRPDLLASGVEIVPTFRRPHVTLAHADSSTLVNALLSCDHELIVNPHHDGGGA